MNTKYKHMLNYVQEQRNKAYVKGYKDGKQKSFAKGFLVGFLSFTIFIGLWYYFVINV